jgi:predicted 3-demethylubiquinone-9 3-methyltransferase (glyoxalase superfamily)
MKEITPFLMFNGQAEEAIKFYTSVFPNSEMLQVTNYDESNEKIAPFITFKLNGQVFHCIDSHVKRDFTFTPAVSFYITCESVEEITKIYEELKLDGMVLMPLDSYPFSRKFTWVQDKFGVSWQLTLE